MLGGRGVRKSDKIKRFCWSFGFPYFIHHQLPDHTTRVKHRCSPHHVRNDANRTGFYQSLRQPKPNFLLDSLPIITVNTYKCKNKNRPYDRFEL